MTDVVTKSLASRLLVYWLLIREMEREEHEALERDVDLHSKTQASLLLLYE